MIDRTVLTWWPFEVIPAKDQNQEHKAEIEFLTTATDLGYRAYMDGNDFGAVADDGRECRVIWRGNHRRELLLMECDKSVRKQLFACPDEGTAFSQAAQAALAFLHRRTPNAAQAAVLGVEPAVGDVPEKLPSTRGAAHRN